MSATLLRPTEFNSTHADSPFMTSDLEPICRELDAPAPEKILMFSTVTVLGIISFMLGWPYVLLVAAGLACKVAMNRYDANHE